MLCGKFVQPKRGGDITDDGYKSSEEWSGVKEGRVSSPLTPRDTPRGGNRLIQKPNRGKISSQEEGMNLRNRSKLMTFNLEDFEPVDTKKGSWSKGLGKLWTEKSSVEDMHQNCSRGQDGQVSTQSKNDRNVEPSGIPKKKYFGEKEGRASSPNSNKCSFPNE